MGKLDGADYRFFFLCIGKSVGFAARHKRQLPPVSYPHTGLRRLGLLFGLDSFLQFRAEKHAARKSVRFNGVSLGLQ
jgi:hypothetical protein